VFGLRLRIRNNGKHQVVRAVRKYAVIIKGNTVLLVLTRIIDGRRRLKWNSELEFEHPGGRDEVMLEGKLCGA
jgi:hypothetical protein